MVLNRYVKREIECVQKVYVFIEIVYSTPLQSSMRGVALPAIEPNSSCPPRGYQFGIFALSWWKKADEARFNSFAIEAAHATCAKFAP